MVLKTLSTSLVGRPCASVYASISASIASPTAIVPLPFSNWTLIGAS